MLLKGKPIADRILSHINNKSIIQEISSEKILNAFILRIRGSYLQDN
ncbi:Uncharacterized protein M832_02600 [Chlamydia avium 10DC88]|uniref:Uncharacterized protein n=2 Tax=Chlamydia avium TaxID=1457141 RepID=W8JG10_9CHLA|nr:Uncharacterized protein M832_02600 [Chlamydia avium 10DC88]EPP36819.1 hypothetical protein CP10743SC13_0578 [Chlamydia psittaci 10_743_SC13]EPP38141.1 hypothetical protein CP10881SC42_0661 [Chlamydia avium]